MNSDDFEKQLSRQPMRRVPTAWRDQILSAAHEAHDGSMSPSSLFVALKFQISTINLQLSTLLWPSPKAWAGLAALWLVVVALNLSSGGRTETLARHSPPPSQQALAALREQERVLAELLRSEQRPPQPSMPPKPAATQPRSDRSRENFEV
jgi:hypothetical protein